MVLYYVNGRWATSAGAIRARFPNAHAESISVTASINDGDWLDVETGDAFPWEAPAWCQERRSHGVNPGVYVEYSKWAATKNEFHMRGIPEPRWWIALWDRSATLLAGADGKQYDHPPTSGGHYDLSVFRYTFGGGGQLPSGGSFMAALTDAQQAQLAQQITDIHGSFGTAPGETLVDAISKKLAGSISPVAQQISDIHGSFGTAPGDTLVTVIPKAISEAIVPQIAELTAQIAALVVATNTLSGKIDAAFVRPSESPGP